MNGLRASIAGLLLASTVPAQSAPTVSREEDLTRTPIDEIVRRECPGFSSAQERFLIHLSENAGLSNGDAAANPSEAARCRFVDVGADRLAEMAAAARSCAPGSERFSKDLPALEAAADRWHRLRLERGCRRP